MTMDPKAPVFTDADWDALVFGLQLMGYTPGRARERVAALREANSGPPDPVARVAARKLCSHCDGEGCSLCDHKGWALDLEANGGSPDPTAPPGNADHALAGGVRPAQDPRRSSDLLVRQANRLYRQALSSHGGERQVLSALGTVLDGLALVLHNRGD